MDLMKDFFINSFLFILIITKNLIFFIHLIKKENL